jgi:hypothetical protein
MGLFYLKIKNMIYEKKHEIMKSPDLSKMKEVIIDARTRIYIAHDASIEEAISRYHNRPAAQKVKI